MADAKKDAKKPDGGGGGGIESEIVFWVLIGAMIMFVVFPTVLNFFNVSVFSGDVDPTSSSTDFSTIVNNIFEGILHIFSSLVSVVTSLSLFLILIFGMAVFYAKFKLKIVQDHFAAQNKKANNVQYVATTSSSPVSVHSLLPGAHPSIETPIVLPVNPRWKNIEDNMRSSNSSDWRLAILEADIILFDMLDQMGFEGQSIADKLKQTNRQNFTTVDDAWKAHKVRNVIAHEGAAYQLSRTEAERTIALYKKVFDEFYFV